MCAGVDAILYNVAAKNTPSGVIQWPSVVAARRTAPRPIFSPNCVAFQNGGAAAVVDE